MFEAVAVIAGFNDMAVMSESVEQSRGHLFINKYMAPFGEAQISRHDDTGFFIQLTDQVEK